jgi:hypothetical protein
MKILDQSKVIYKLEAKNYSMPPGIPTGFIRKLYRILDHESPVIISWDPSGTSFSIHDASELNQKILPLYFRGRLGAFRQQLIDHGFEQIECEDDEERECYWHEHFERGCPDRLNFIERNPQPKKKYMTKTLKQSISPNSSQIQVPPNVQASPLSMKVRIPLRHQASTSKKRSREEFSEVPVYNPLFSRDPPSASPIELLASTALPEPITFEKIQPQPPMQQQNEDQMFSDEMIRSAMYYLVSTSSSDMDPMNPSALPSAIRNTNTNGSDTLDTLTRWSSSITKFLSGSFLPWSISDTSTGSKQPSTTTSTTATTTSMLSDDTGTATGSSKKKQSLKNPLFVSYGEDDDLWTLLVASSIDRVKTSIGSLKTPQEKMNLIISEREKLEEQRHKFTKPSIQSGFSSLPLTSKQSKKKNTSAKETKTSSNPLFTKNLSSNAKNKFSIDSSNWDDLPPLGASEDALWQILFSSSVDFLKKNAEELEKLGAF